MGDPIRSRPKHHQSQSHQPQLRSGWRVVCRSFFSSASFLFLHQPWVRRREVMRWTPRWLSFKHLLRRGRQRSAEEKERRVAKRGRRVPKRMAGPERRTAPEEEGNRQGHEKETMATNQSLIEDKDRGIQKQRKTKIGKRTRTKSKPRKMNRNLVE